MMRAIAHYFTMIVDLVNAIRSHQNSCALSLFFPGISAHDGILVEYGDDEEFNLKIQDHLMVHTRT